MNKEKYDTKSTKNPHREHFANKWMKRWINKKKMKKIQKSSFLLNFIAEKIHCFDAIANLSKIRNFENFEIQAPLVKLSQA